jgi:hypothetical protein
MPDQLVVLIAVIGIVIVGFAFTAIDLVKDAGRLIGLGLLVFLVVLLLNRALPQTATIDPSSPYSPAPSYPSSPNQPTSPPFSFDAAYNGFSNFIRSALRGIDEFVYGNPYSVGQQPAPDSQPAESVPPEDQGYQIRPDGVPSRVSTLVEPEPATGAPTTAAPASTSRRRPVSAWW